VDVTEVFDFGGAGFFSVTILLRESTFLVTALATVFSADVVEALRVAFFAAFLDFAQRVFCAAPILARASALILRRFEGFSANPAELTIVAMFSEDTLAGRPNFRFTVVSVSVRRALTFCNCAISASIAKTISLIFMNPPLSRIAYGFALSDIVPIHKRTIACVRQE